MSQVKTISFNDADIEYLAFMKSNGSGATDVCREALILHKQKQNYKTLDQVQQKFNDLDMLISEACVERDELAQQLLQMKPKQEALSHIERIKGRRDQIGPLVAAIKLSSVSIMPAALSSHSATVESMDKEERSLLLQEHEQLTREFVSHNQTLLALEGGSNV